MTSVDSNRAADRPMRRGRQRLSIEACRDVLTRGTSGVLALKGAPDDFPYAVPLSYVHVPTDALSLMGGEHAGDESAVWEAGSGASDGASSEADSAASDGLAGGAFGSIFFHCAKKGLKLDLIAKDPRASFCVVDQDRVVPEKFTTFYRSVIAFGEVRVVEDRARALAATRALGRKYNSGEEKALERELDSAFPHMLVLELKIDALTGKQAKELVTR